MFKHHFLKVGKNVFWSMWQNTLYRNIFLSKFIHGKLLALAAMAEICDGHHGV